MIDADRLRAALASAREQIDDACARSGRDPHEVEIVLAGKYIAPEDAPALVAAGVTVVGENRLQDLQAKRAVVGDALVFDFIGHLQRRKVRQVLDEVRLVHAVDSESLVHEIDRRSPAPARVLVQVNTSGEDSKHGIVPGQIQAFVEMISSSTTLVVGGLMTLPPPSDTPGASRPYFAGLREMRDDLAARWEGRHDFRDLSMGTSQDFVVAVEEGATKVRIGRAMIDQSQVS